MNLRPVLAVSIWEFRRFCKVKDLLMTLAFWVAGGLVYVGVMAIVARSTEEDLARIVVLNPDVLAFDASDVVAIEAANERDEVTLRRLVEDGDLDGVLILHAVDRAVLIVPGDRLWQEQLQSILDAAVRDARLRDSDLAADDLERLTAPFDLELALSGGQTAAGNKWTKIFGFVFIGLMMFGVLLGNSYLFVGITGEKQHRVTEQVVAAISPQTWIDGKIIGLSLMVFVMLANLCVCGLVTNLMLGVLGRGVDLSSLSVDPMLIGQLGIVALLGFFFWFTFFAAIAATIDDPNTSSRSSLLFIPLLPLALSFFAFINPDTTLIRVLAILPPTAPTVLPARLILTDVAAWETVVAVILLVASIWMLRRAAGKIFALGILMHGTEPRWRDMWRWLRSV